MPATGGPPLPKIAFEGLSPGAVSSDGNNAFNNESGHEEEEIIDENLAE